MNQVDTIALCWCLERGDGAGVALTSHDAPITLQGVRYDPAPGLLPAAIQKRGALNPSSSEIDGAIGAAALTEEDLELGRWDGALVRLDIAAWDEPDRPAVNLLTGEIGDVAVNGRGFTAELIGPAARLDEPVCPSTSSECRAQLGDRDCRADLSGRRSFASVVASTGERVTLDAAYGGGLTGGVSTIVSGSGCGWTSPIVASEGGDIVLRDAPRFAVHPGTRVWVEEGCDKSFATCRDRFRNALNFRGEPHLPGNDLLTRYPGG